MKMNPYLSFKGDCEAAFRFYEQCLGGKMGDLFRYAGSPLANQVPADWGDKIMHGGMTLGGHELMGADEPPERYIQPKGFTLALNIKGAAEADRIFHDLAQGGKVVVPLEKTFWAERFGIVVDRFGIPWAINGEA